MSSAELALRIPRPYLPADQRPAFKQEVSVFAGKVRRALNQIGQYEPVEDANPLIRPIPGRNSETKREVFDPETTKAFIDKQRRLIRSGRFSVFPESDRVKLEAMEEQVRVVRINVKEIILKVKGIKTTRAAVLVAQPQQIPPPQTTIAEGIVHSPPDAHQDTRLAIHGPVRVDLLLQKAIGTEVEKRYPKATGPAKAIKAQGAEAVARIFNLSIRGEASSSTPLGLRDPQRVAHGVVHIANLISLRDAGLLTMPSDEELGRPTKDQARFAMRYVDFLTAYVVSEEAKNPHRTYEQWQKFYLGMCKEISVRTRRIGEHGRGLLAAIINNLPDVQSSILISRLSDNLMQAVKYPALMLVGERRIAQMLRRVAFIEGAIRDDRVSTLLDVISFRVDQGDLNPALVMEHLSSLNYSGYIIEQMWKAADEDGKAILIDMLGSHPAFREVRRKYQDRFERYDYDDPKVERIWKDDEEEGWDWSDPKADKLWLDKFIDENGR